MQQATEALLKHIKHVAREGNCYVVTKTDAKGEATYILYRSNGYGAKGSSIAKTKNVVELEKIVKKSVKTA